MFDYNDVRKMDSDWTDKPYWWFDCAMVSTCEPVFNHCDSNHEVESELRKAKVLRKNNRTDTEMCSLVVLFSSEKAGNNFIDRLNAYLESKGLKSEHTPALSGFEKALVGAEFGTR
jgi:hypothetical protein